MSSGDDFEAMQAALRETARGRWFLDELARRARSDETQVLLDAIGRIERAVGTPAPAALQAPIPESPSGDAEMRLEGPPRGAFDKAASDILDAAEGIQETAWAMREEGAEPALCDRLDGYAAAIYAGCGRQARILDRASRSATAEPPRPERTAAEAEPIALPRTAVTEPSLDMAAIARFLNLDDIDRLTVREKLRLFT